MQSVYHLYRPHHHQMMAILYFLSFQVKHAQIFGCAWPTRNCLIFILILILITKLSSWPDKKSPFRIQRIALTE